MNTIRQLARSVGMWTRLFVGCGVCLYVTLICKGLAMICAFGSGPPINSTSYRLADSFSFGLCYGALVAFGGMALRPHWVGLPRYLWRLISTSLVTALVVHTANVLMETQEFQSIVRWKQYGWVAPLIVYTMVGAVSGLIGYRGAADKEKHGTSALQWAVAAAAAQLSVYVYFIIVLLSLVELQR